MKRLIITLTLSVALHSLSAFASMPSSTTISSPLSTQQMIEYIDHTHQLTTAEKVQTDVVSSINKNNYLQINSHKDAHLEQREIARRPKKKYTSAYYTKANTHP
ncbi:hypothetical protein UA38_06980 [Photobacterium kishitanii]|uniref:DUF4148 domain-containing protein n=1 Tax=Photobacterium kishitanii TaxID=318456 RepID=A0AAX0YQK2_9GAMM|nr:hypothetical protein [Photobacterium kishitanii]KJG10023.1 hypothetical protein UB40_09730 [Photobacterium kishitanii]KJG58299.1 hypothetical protein UA38_06980 [Photobacterium kishitanii]KJG61924.1 hypothetical protein UA42_07680 [Photobacterium kishitanii]KJG66099.1 hypothetical protein UA40_08885 [Photobacterium kishitanii]KJG69916.1 hypothetical protein UA41_08810 [Photobacterium kishitanii]